MVDLRLKAGEKKEVGKFSKEVNYGGLLQFRKK